MTRWDAFTDVCAHLRGAFLDGAPPPPSGLPWELLIEASSRHNVTPALAWAVRERTDLPADIRAYFDAVLALNGKRNEALLSTLERMVAACNAVGVEPVLLKGAARLVEGIYPAPSLRLLGDLDVLVPRERTADVLAALHDDGFCPDEDAAPVPPGHHHLPMLRDSRYGGGVELHVDAAGVLSRAIIDTDWFVAGTRPATFRALNVRLPDPTRSVGQVVAHDQLDHEGYLFRTLELRQLLDVAVLRTRYENAIDWSELDRRFSRAKSVEVLATYLGFAEALLGQARPQLGRAPRCSAMEDLRRAVAPTRAERVGLIGRRIAALVRRDPSSLLRVFHLRNWPDRMRRVLRK